MKNSLYSIIFNIRVNLLSNLKVKTLFGSLYRFFKFNFEARYDYFKFVSINNNL